MLDNSNSAARERNRFRFTNLLFFLFCAVLLAYVNHFENGFHFDDSHTISDNPAIQTFDVVRFFADGSTFSSLPSNQSYRPWITTVNALDYSIRGGLYPGVFHVHIFLTFLISVGLLAYFVRKTLAQTGFSVPRDRRSLTGTFLDNISPGDQLALSVAALFGLLCANAETVNYIIQRAEIEAGLFILAGFVAFLQGGSWRKWHLYMVFPVMGFFAKEMAFTFAPLLLLYLLIFEEKTDLLHFYRRAERSKVLRAFWKSIPAFAVTLVAGLFYASMLPDTFSTGSSDRFAYLITQPFVIGHYVLTFFVPYNLSADTDWTTFSSLSDYRVWVGFVFVAGLLYVALRASANQETRMVSFGLLWFLITLLPTSSVIPLAEVLNDHRCFIPYMGLTMAVAFGVRYLLLTYFPRQLRQQGTQRSLWVLFFLVLTANAYGVHERNKVWRNDLTLWKDVTEKSPRNGRGYMNYGLALMAQGDYALAEANFLKAATLFPDYALVYVNLGILHHNAGNPDDADRFFQQALRASTADHQANYYYGKFLFETDRSEEARAQLEQALSIHPGDHRSRSLLDELSLREEAGESGFPTVYDQARAAVFLNESLTRFNAGDYQGCIDAAERALELHPDYPAAYNNIGIANVRLGRYEEGIAAYRKALELDPEYQLVKNNLAEAMALSKH